VLKEFLNEMLAQLTRTLANVSSPEGPAPTTQKQDHALPCYYLSHLRGGSYRKTALLSTRKYNGKTLAVFIDYNIQ
jgi:hypothetical protein